MSTIIKTARFQTLQVQPDKVFSFPQGLIGFESYRDFVLIDRANKSLFFWLQSFSHPDLCFLLIESAKVLDSYKPVLSKEDNAFLQIKNGSEISFLSLVTVEDESHENIFINLKSPIALNPESRIGRQIILDEDCYPVRYPLKNLSNHSKTSKILETAVIKMK